MKYTGASSIVCFTILVLLDEEYWSFQYRVFYNTSITSILGWRILELPVLCIDQWFWYSSIVNAWYWYIQYCIYTILDFRYCSITILVFLVLYSVTILVLPISRCNCKDNALLYKIILYKVASLHFWKKLHFSMALILGDKFPIWR